jgi:hypothetical protein
MHGQQQLKLAPEAMHVQCTFRPDGWQLTLIMRRQGQSWGDAYSATYDHLTTAELGDTLCAEVCQLLGLA